MKKLIFALIAGATAMSAAHAEGPYVGVGIATASRNYNVPPSATNVSDDGYRASGKIFGGYDFDQTLGVELGYTDFRNANVTSTIPTTAGGTVTSTVSHGGHSTYLAGKATAPLNEQFNVFGKLGIAQTKIETTGASDNNTEGYLAVGGEYKLNKNVAFTLEYERYGKNKDFGPKPNVWTVAAKYNF